MKTLTRWSALYALAFPLALAGCGGGPPDTKIADATKAADDRPAMDRGKDAEAEAELKANLARLDPADRELAEAQRYCVVEAENRLGAMGVPVKIEVKGRPVFLCCKSCRKQALAHPVKTFGKADELRRAAGPAK
jgi:hypothetical protein